MSLTLDTPIYYLTPLTGREAAEQRTTMIKGFETNARNFRMGLIAAAAAIVPGFVMYSLLSIVFGGVMFAAIFVSVFWLLQGRSRRGLHLRMYQTLLDQQKAKNVVNRVFIGTEEADPLLAEAGMIVESSVWVGRADTLGDRFDRAQDGPR